jgi:hypothetical protein
MYHQFTGQFYNPVSNDLFELLVHRLIRIWSALRTLHSSYTRLETPLPPPIRIISLDRGNSRLTSEGRSCTENEGPVRINVRFRFMYARIETVQPGYFQNRIFNVLSPNFHIHVSVSALYIPRTGLPILCSQIGSPRSWEYIDRSQEHECRNWQRGCAVSFLRTHKSDFWYSAYRPNNSPLLYTGNSGAK